MNSAIDGFNPAPIQDVPLLQGSMSPSPKTPAALLPSAPSPAKNSVDIPAKKIADESPKEGLLHGIANMLAIAFVGKGVDTLAESFQLYKGSGNANLPSKALEIVKAAGRAGALVLGSLMVGLSRGVAFLGGAGLGLLLTSLVTISGLGLLWILCSENPFKNLKDTSALIATAAAAIPAFIGANLQACAFQTGKEGGKKIDATDLFQTTWKQHSVKEGDVGLAEAGAGIGVGIGIAAGLFVRAVAAFAK